MQNIATALKRSVAILTPSEQLAGIISPTGEELHHIVIIIIIIIIFRNRTMNQKFCRKFTISVSSKAFAQAIVIVC